jgi:PPOX class probable F420-dependent enzyme
MIPLAGRALGPGLAYDNPSHGAAAVSDPLAEPRPAERLSIEPIAWLTTAGADGQPQSSPVWFHWDGSAFWLRTQVGARKVTNIRANPKVALHLADDGNGADIVTVEGTAELWDGWSDDVESAFLAKYDEAIRTAIGTTFEQLRIDYPVTIRVRPTRTRTW